ncbi:MAG: hypothetical protein H7A25_19385 [Leptospiraceae bacterium]|nr:hypothetical protein [Leptospiraceae bacterium]MCP5502071.1 hypothetical protein [Leptospiraceae bacterium]
MDEKKIIEALEQTLIGLYRDKERLEEGLGTSDCMEIVSIYRNLEAQLQDLYKERENAIFIEGKEIVIEGSRKIRILTDTASSSLN